MTRIRHIWLKNLMLLGNLLANLVGIGLVTFLLSRPISGLPQTAWEFLDRVGWYFDPIAFTAVVFIVLLYERPIRHYLNLQFTHAVVPSALELKARQKMLNEPYFLMALNFCLWLSASIFYSLALLISGMEIHQLGSGVLRSLFTGLVTCIVAFFVLERLKQKWLAPHFFPQGGLYRTPGILRIRIGTRLAAMLFACNIIPCLGILNMLYHMRLAGGDPARVLERLSSALYTEIPVFMGMGIWVTILVTRNMTLPLRSIIDVLKGVRRGNFDKEVRVTRSDEIGYTGDVINEMTNGLKEREFIKETFGKYVTEEIRDEILSGAIPLDGEAKEVTYLFADLRDFTPMVESTPPKEVVKILNDYFKEMEEAIQQNHGLVLQYIGDEIEAVFGAPVPREDHPRLAVRAALEMRGRLRGVNQDLQQRGYEPLSHGIGIHTGKVVAANIGSPHRLSYTLVGDTVNLASRLQGLNREFDTEIIISASTRAYLDDGPSLRELPSTRVKGKSREVEIFALV